MALKADLVLHGGTILGYPASDSIAVAGGTILALGQYRDLKPLVGPRTHLIRLAGRVVAPGLIDSHLHFLGSRVRRLRPKFVAMPPARGSAGRIAGRRGQGATGQLAPRIRM